jgi:hypothetical protein
MGTSNKDAEMRLLALTIHELIATIAVLNEDEPTPDYGVAQIVEKAHLVLQTLDL